MGLYEEKFWRTGDSSRSFHSLQNKDSVNGLDQTSSADVPTYSWMMLHRRLRLGLKALVKHGFFRDKPEN